VADEQQLVAVALDQPGEIVRLDAEQDRVLGERHAELGGHQLGGLVGTRVGARDDALRLDLERDQGTPRGACGAAPCRHQPALRIGSAERAILGLSVSDEDDCHGPSIDRTPGARTSSGRLVTGSSPFVHPANARRRTRAIAILPG